MAKHARASRETRTNGESSSAFRNEAEVTAEKERKIQRDVDRSEAKSSRSASNWAMQAGARLYPVPPLPKQHLSKPGEEAELKLAPMYDAPHYKVPTSCATGSR